MAKQTEGASCTINKSGALVVEIPAQFLVNTFEMGVNTNICAKVNDRKAMLEHFKRAFENADFLDGEFGRFLDVVAADAIESGESFVDLEDDDF